MNRSRIPETPLIGLTPIYCFDLTRDMARRLISDLLARRSLKIFGELLVG